MKLVKVMAAFCLINTYMTANATVENNCGSGQYPSSPYSCATCPSGNGLNIYYREFNHPQMGETVLWYCLSETDARIEDLGLTRYQ